ncbi:MAG: glycosyltransferase family 39 protein [Candidatus Hydrogenedentes bacterium]|nr:glycosyltransferase family 39 protein [Candidatus Hydrogenedentota bacterium]
MNGPVRSGKRWILAAILTFSFLVRATGLFWGIGLFSFDGGLYHPDEPKIVRYVSNLPDSFHEQTDFRYPLGLHHALALVYLPLKTLAGLPGMEFWAPESVTAFQWTFLVCRLFVVILGTLSVYLVYRVVLLSTGEKKSAYIAALFLSFLPYPVQNSAFVTTDVPLSLASIAVVYAYLRVDRLPRPSALAWSLLGALSGAAVGIKYTGAYLVAALGVLFLWRYARERRPWPDWLRGIAAMATGGVLAFAIATPQCVMSPELILHGITREMDRVDALSWSAGMYAQSFWEALGIPGAMAAAIAVAVLLRKPSPHARVLAVFALAFLILTVKGLQARYVITIAPLLAVAVGLACERVKGRAICGALAASLVACSMLLVSCLYARYAWDTRSEATRLIQSRYPAGATVGMAVIGSERKRQNWREPRLDKERYAEVRLQRSPDLIVATAPPHELLLSTGASEELNAWYQRYGLETPRAEWEVLYQELASPNSGYRLVERFLPTRLPLEFAGYPLAIYERVAR